MGQAEGVGKGHAGGLKAELGITVAKGETLAIDRAKAENMTMGEKDSPDRPLIRVSPRQLSPTLDVSYIGDLPVGCSLPHFLPRWWRTCQI